jgi:hypothetical protein
MANLRSEERMRQFYIDLGADPEELTPESDIISVFVGIIKKALEKEDRMDTFRENVDKRSEPVAREMEEYGSDFGLKIKSFITKILSPAMRFFDPIRRLFGYERSEDERLENILKSDFLSGSIRWLGGFSSEVLTESGAAGFIGGTMGDFFMNYGIIEDIATYERFSVINNFIAEIQGSEELKKLDAEYFAEDMIGGIESGILSMRDAVRLVSPSMITSGINDAILNNLPRQPLHLTIDDAGLTVDGIMNEVGTQLTGLMPKVRKVIEELIIPSFGIPIEFLEDERAQEAVKEILGNTAEPTISFIGTLFKDPRFTDIIGEVFSDLMNIAPLVVNDVDSILNDPRTARAAEDLIVNMLTDDEIWAAIGDLISTLLSDEEFLVIVEDTLYDSIAEATHGYRRFEFKLCHVTLVGIGLLPVPPEYLRTAGHNGLFYFTQVLMEWLRGENLPPDVISPSQFLRHYLGDYMTEDRVRDNIASPVVSLGLNIAGDIINNPDLLTLVSDSVYLALSKDPLGLIGEYITKDQRLSSLISQTIEDFPLSALASSLRGSGLKDLAKDLSDMVPLEGLVPYITHNRNIRGLIQDTAVKIDLSPVKNIVPLDPAIPGTILDQIANFPAGILTGFFRENDRAYKIGYTIADVQARFAVDLLENPELALLQRDLIHEKIAEADYTLAESIFNAIAKITDNDKLADFIAKISGEGLGELYKLIQEKLKSAASWGLNTVKRFFTWGLFPAFLLVPLSPGRIRARRPGRAKK